MDKKIKNIIERINNKSNNDIAFTGNTIEKVTGQSTGVELLDYATGVGGFPVGRITEIFGKESVAKTSLALFTIAQAQRDGKICLFIDAEFALDLEHAKTLGVDIGNLIVIRPFTGEEALSTVEQMLLDGEVNFIVIDSIPSLVPAPEIESEMNKPTMGGQARLIASGLRKIVPLVARQNAVLVVINQLRVNIMGGMYDPYITPGGMSLRFYTTIRLQLKIVSKLKKGDEIVGQRIKFQMKKNKVGQNKLEGEIDFIYKEGFKSEVNIIEVAIQKGVVTKNGNTYSYKDTKLGVGKERANEYLQENPELLKEIKSLC